MLSEVFYMAVLSTGSGIGMACLALLYKSKCEDVNLCCGIIKIHRNISSEVLEDMAQNSTVSDTHATNNGITSHVMRSTGHPPEPLQIER
jgi:hypothetical protein